MLQEGQAYTWNGISDCSSSQGFESIAWKFSFSDGCCKGVNEEVLLASVESVEERVMGEADWVKVFDPLSVGSSLVFMCCSCNCSFMGTCSSNEASQDSGEAERDSVSVRFWLVLSCWGQNPERERQRHYFSFLGTTVGIPWYCGGWKGWCVSLQFWGIWLLWLGLLLLLKKMSTSAILWMWCCPSSIKHNPQVEVMKDVMIVLLSNKR